MKRPTSPAGERGLETSLEPARTARDVVLFRRLLRAAQLGDRGARERLAAAHLGLVRAVASDYRDAGLPLDDVVQEGAIGLLDAIDRYDADRGASFDTYARLRIRRSIRNALTEKARVIRLPKHVLERRRAIGHAEVRLAAAAGGRIPSATEIAIATGLSVESVEDVRAVSVATVSLDEPVLPDGSLLANLVADPRAADPEVRLLEQEQTALLTAALEQLPQRQRSIVRSRCGIGDAQVPNAVLASKLALSPRRSRTIYFDALCELRRGLGSVETPEPRERGSRSGSA